ncbi:hypothetical protein ACFLZ2_01745 [Candidatus Margulisiibacteriota bacterium]
MSIRAPHSRGGWIKSNWQGMHGSNPAFRQGSLPAPMRAGKKLVIPQSRITEIILYGDKVTLQEVKEKMKDCIDNDHIYNALIEGGRIKLGIVRCRAGVGHDHITKPSKSSDGVYGAIEIERVHIAFAAVLPNEALTVHLINSYIRLARFFIEAGLPADRKVGHTVSEFNGLYIGPYFRNKFGVRVKLENIGQLAALPVVGEPKEEHLINLLEPLPGFRRPKVR